MSKFPVDRPSLGPTPAERAYRRWALAEGLFLNPLLVIGPHSIAATDRRHLPAHTAAIGDPPEFIAWFNQMKQEFVGARWFLYDADCGHKKHFADKHVGFVNTLDYAAFGLQIEKARAAFRVAYGLLDKVAGFINAYYRLGLEPTRVDIRNVWHEKKSVIRTPFAAKQNLQLRGLYWLAQDIVGHDPSDQDSIAPEACHLKKLRNLLEHRCLVLREMDLGDPMGVVETEMLREFQASTLQVLRLARAALMYLAFSMKQEERARRKKDEFVPAMSLRDL
jgi:LA2681-like HEPN